MKGADCSFQIQSASQNAGGMLQPGRSFSTSGYRFGFNGKEQDELIKGSGNQLDFGARGYDSRLIRWWSVDPKSRMQAGWSTYKAFLDNPILYVDPDGETEYITIITTNEKSGETTIEVKKSDLVMTDGKKHMRGGSAAWHYENDYYDFSTVILRTVGVDGKVNESSNSHILYDKKKSSEFVWFGGDKDGDTKTEKTFGWVPKISDYGGLVIYGSASSNEDSPGMPTNAKSLGSLNFKEFSEIIGIAATAIRTSGENTLVSGASGTKFADLINKAKIIVENHRDNFHKICNNCQKLLDSTEESTHQTLGDGTRDTLITPQNE